MIDYFEPGKEEEVGVCGRGIGGGWREGGGGVRDGGG